MKELLFVDTGYLVALVNKKDINHSKAVEINKELKEKNHEYMLVFSDYIFDEFISLLQARNIDNSVIIDAGEKLLFSKFNRRIRIIDEYFISAWDMVKKISDKSWSFTDCTSFTMMKEMNIKRYLGFDEHFTQAGFIPFT